MLEKHISVKAAAEFSGYNVQYLRRLLGTDRLESIKIGQVWLIKLATLRKGTDSSSEALSPIANLSSKQT